MKVQIWGFTASSRLQMHNYQFLFFCLEKRKKEHENRYFGRTWFGKIPLYNSEKWSTRRHKCVCLGAEILLPSDLSEQQKLQVVSLHRYFSPEAKVRYSTPGLFSDWKTCFLNLTHACLFFVGVETLLHFSCHRSFTSEDKVKHSTTGKICFLFNE